MALNLGTAVFPAILIADTFLGDPVYAWHPIRLMGRAVTAIENKLFAHGLNTKFGGILLVLAMTALFVGPVWFLHHFLWSIAPVFGFAWDVYWGFHCIALQDLLKHTGRIGKAVAKGDIAEARIATSMLVGRDTEPMDGHACCRAGIESLSENLTDGVIAPLFWFVILGVPGMVFFKIASTLDSMVGYKSPRYLQFGWAGARLDDLLNFIPARLTWAMTVFVAAILPGYSARKAFHVGLTQHQLAPGPNSGWSETAFAGALELRIAGPIYKAGVMVTDIWLGKAHDRTDASPTDIERAARLATWVTLTFALSTLPIWAR